MINVIDPKSSDDGASTSTERADRSGREEAFLRCEFPSRIAHDIRSPLGIVAGTLAELRRAGDNLDPAQRQLLDLTQRAVAQLQRIADRLSLVARLESGKIEWEPRHLALRPVLERAVEEIAQTRRRRSIKVELEIPDDLPTVAGDANLLQKACEELVDNAIRHARSAVVLQAASHGKAVALSVSNDGTSPLDAHDDLFARFVPSVSRAGLGLGLSIVRDIAAQHGGDVQLVGIDPVTFRLLLPTRLG